MSIETIPLINLEELINVIYLFWELFFILLTILLFKKGKSIFM